MSSVQNAICMEFLKLVATCLELGLSGKVVALKEAYEARKAAEDRYEAKEGWGDAVMDGGGAAMPRPGAF